MNFGTSCKNDFERVRQSMFDNQRRDTVPSMRSIVGHEDRVWNLRPLQKEKHIDKEGFRYKAKTQMDRIHELNMTEVNRYMMNEEIGLPPINKNQMRLFKAVELIKNAQQSRHNKSSFQPRKDREDKVTNRAEINQLVAGIMFDEKVDINKAFLKEQKLNQVSPSSPLKVANYNRNDIVPFKSLNKKTYFKTLEHVAQNMTNETRKKFN